MNPGMVMYEEDFEQIQKVCRRLYRDADAMAVLLIDRNGQLLAETGETDGLDTTSLSSLTAGNVAATGGIAKLLKEKEFAGQFHEGEGTNVYITPVAQRVILVILFDERSTLGLVRLRLRGANEELTQIFEALTKRAEKPDGPSIFSEITDADIDNLFND
ncbi:MAG: roadblock/LC7 domain-containing protein [Pseudomonadota bacterium]